MRKSKVLILAVLFAFLAAQVIPAGFTGSRLALAQDAPEDFPILRCTDVGITGDLANTRGIVFTVSQAFKSVEVRMAASVAGGYSFTAELRRSSGFTAATIATVNVNATVPQSGSEPYKPVTLNFGSITVSGSETFSLRFSSVSGQGSLYFETYGIGNKPCANVMETDENNIANPTERGDPAGFKVLAASPSSFSLSSIFASTPPTIDGVLSFGEWNNASRLQFENGFITVLNDNLRLYVLIDVLDDVVDDANDYFWLAFDKDRDGVIDANQDLMYNLNPQNGNMRYQFFLNPNTWTGLQSSTYSSKGRGFGCFLTDGTFFFTLNPFSVSCKQHRVWELAIDLDEIGSNAGGSAKMGLRAASVNPAFTNEVPVGMGGSFSNYIGVSLAPSPYLFILPDPAAVIDVETQAIELTQAIQDRNNTLPLVADKTTAARVYVDVDNVGASQYAEVFLYASDGSVDLPGSPLAMIHTAPVTIDRSQLSHTANFLLPSSWDGGNFTFQAKSKDWYGNTDQSTPFTKGFSSREVPTVWIVPVNFGTNASPILPSNTEISSQESAMEAVMPVKDIAFVRKDWTAIGTASSLDDAIGKLNTYYGQAVLAWLLSVIFGGGPPFDLPDQIYGFAPSGGGTSDPIWYYGNGYVASGYRGSSRELTMAHEVNHNLDRDATGTWGRHVPGGCGATGPDSAWPYANDDIQEVGFDTRLPWQDNATEETAISTNWPDFMSYCQSVKLPTKWISPYRWQNQFNRFALAASAEMLERIDQVTLVYYVSGLLLPNGTGSLDPVVEQQGLPSENVVPGEYSIEVQDRSGAPMYTLPFGANFEDLEGGQRTVVPFNFMIPYQKGATQIVLKYQKNTLDTQAYSTNPPVINLVEFSPAERLEALRGQITIQWQATDADGDTVTVDILYSPDMGQSWYPLASDLTGTGYVVDTANLVGGSQAIFRVIASDGFRNDQDDLDNPIKVADNPPLVSISGPVEVPVGASASFQGSAMDPEDGPLPEGSLAWELDGHPIAGGAQISPQLSFGPHTLVLYATDSQGNTGQASLEIFYGNKLFLPLLSR